MQFVRGVSLLFLPVPAALAQQFTVDTASVPAGAFGYTESAAFGDVDRDGDWDVVFANGGDFGNQQNRMWINLGDAQGGTIGTFADETAARFPAVTDTSRDLEFADYDGDGDLDLHTSNDAQISNQACRFWTNQGGAQGGAIGFYVDETASRWVGLGAFPSSVSPAAVLGSGGFIDWSGESAFADLDDDGDLDLIHTSHGSSYSGNVPIRVFRNDGLGHFSEFNPSGFVAGNLANGNPGLWCEGVQQNNTTVSDGTFCDVTAAITDVDVGDLDQDFDVDFVVDSRNGVPRLFSNRMVQNGGALGFRDTTGAAFPTGFSAVSGRYGQELGDLDHDDDLDLYGINWNATPPTYSDAVYLASAPGAFAAPITVPNSGGGEDGTFIDYDLDGDLDLIASNFDSQDRVHRNDAGVSFPLATGIMPSDSSPSRDVAVADTDADGDHDVMFANDSNQAETYLRNGTLANDVTAPAIDALEQAADRVAGPAPTVVHARLFDNVPHAILRFHQVQLVVTVDGAPQPTVAMLSSGGQVFRGALDGSFVGTVRYRVVATDEHGNTASSAQLQFVGTGTGTQFCFGDGSGTACPCGNASPVGANAGCLNSLALAGALRASGTASVGGDTVQLRASSITNASVLFFQGDTRIAAGAGAVFGDGLRCAGGAIVRLGQSTGAANAAVYPEAGDQAVSVRGGLPPSGGTRTYQAWYRNAAGFCTPSTFNLTNGVEIAWAP